MVLPETDAQRLLVSKGAVRGVKTGDKGLGREGEPLAAYEPGVEVHAQATVLSEGTQGHLAGAAIQHFGLSGRFPQVWSLGVKEVWRVAKPLDHVIHTLGWPFRTTRKDREIGGSFIYPMGSDMLAIGLVLGLDYRDSTLSVHDSLQLFKTHPMVRACWRAASGSAGARRRSRRAASWRCRQPLDAGRGADRRQRRVRERAQAEGHPLRDAVGHAGGGGDLRAAEGGRRPRAPPDALAGYDRRVHSATSGATSEGAEHAPGAGQGLRDRRTDRRHDGHQPRRAAAGELEVPPRRRGGVEPNPGKRVTRRRTASSRSTSSRASSCPATAAATTSRTTSASRRTCRVRWRRRGWRCARRRSTRSGETTAGRPCS